MRTVRNQTPTTVPVSWCSVASHYSNGQHTGILGRTACRMQNHTIPPGSAVTFDETAPNGPTLLSLLTPLEV